MKTRRSIKCVQCLFFIERTVIDSSNTAKVSFTNRLHCTYAMFHIHSSIALLCAQQSHNLLTSTHSLTNYPNVTQHLKLLTLPHQTSILDADRHPQRDSARKQPQNAWASF